MLSDEQHARTLLAMYQGWFGPPVLMFRENVIDGRKRLAAWRGLMFNEGPPLVEAQVVKRVRQLYVCAVEDGLTLEPEHLKEALGEWFERPVSVAPRSKPGSRMSSSKD